MKIFKNVSELEAWVGKTLGQSQPLTITQEMINQFAQLTGDNQYIHVDPVRAARESPYSTTIAHGFLVLSLATQFCSTIFTIENASTAINYGVNKVRFPSATKVNSELVSEAKLLAFNRKHRGVQLTVELEIGTAGSDRPTCVAELVTLIVD